MTASASKIPIGQIEIVGLHDLFTNDYDLEGVCLKLLQEYPDKLMDIRDECFWSAAGFVRFLDHWIRSEFYNLVDSSFVYREKLWTSAWRLRDRQQEKSPNYDDDFYRRMDEFEYRYTLKLFKSVCRVKDFLSAHPDCYVFSSVDCEKGSSNILNKVSVVDYDKIVNAKVWEGVFCNYIHHPYNLLLTSDRVIEAIKEYLEYSSLPEDDWQFVELDKAARFLEKKPSLLVAVREYYSLSSVDWN